jgi:membrane-bound serine protease (ClpP class)
MRRLRVLGAVMCICLAAPAGAAAAAAAISSSDRPLVTEIDLSGPIDPLLARYAERAIGNARRDGAAAVLVRLDTPGGLDSSMRSIIKAILRSPVPVLCWVGPSGARAASAGTFILIGCPIAAMAPGTNVGAAHPVGITGGVMSEKVTNDATAYIRSLAESWGRNAAWAERAVRDSVSVSANEALDLHVIDLLAPTRSALLRAVDGRTVRTVDRDVTLHVTGARIVRQHPTLAEALLHDFVDPNFAYLFFILGLISLAAFVIHPGVHVTAFVGVLLLVASLISFGMLPVTVAGLVLLVAGVVFSVVGLKVHGRGLPEMAAITCIVLGGLFLFNPSVPTAHVSRPLIVGVAIADTLFWVFVMRAVLRARFTPVQQGAHKVVGAEGVVLTAIDPTGVVRVKGESWTARSSSGPIPAGATVRVSDVTGLTLEVVPEPAPEEKAVH